MSGPMPWDKRRRARPALQERKRQFLAGAPMTPAPVEEPEPPPPEDNEPEAPEQ